MWVSHPYIYCVTKKASKAKQKQQKKPAKQTKN